MTSTKASSLSGDIWFVLFGTLVVVGMLAYAIVTGYNSARGVQQRREQRVENRKAWEGRAELVRICRGHYVYRLDGRLGIINDQTDTFVPFTADAKVENVC